MPERNKDNILEEKAKKLGHRVGLAVGALYYSGLMYKVLSEKATTEDTIANGLLYGIFIGPLLSSLAYGFTAAVVAGFSYHNSERN